MGKAARSKSARRDRTSLPAPTVVPSPLRKRRFPDSAPVYLAGVFLATAGLLVYLNALRGPFVFDDFPAISNNPTIRALWPPSSVLSPPAKTPVSGRPLVNFSLALNYAISGLNVGSYHLFNVIVHLCAGLVLFGIVRRTLISPELRARYRTHATGIALAASLLWIVHPLATESVNYTIQRTELLMGVFLLFTIYSSIRSFESPDRRIWEIAALGAFALGMASKEVAVVTPVLVLAYDRLFWSKSLRDVWKSHWRLYVGLAIVLVIFVLLIATRFRGAFAGFTRRDVTPWQYALTQTGVIIHYLRLAFFPTALAADYGGWPIAKSIGEVLPSLLVLVALAALTLVGLFRQKRVAFLGVVFFLILAPTSSFRPVPAEVAAERRMYLPLAALVVLIVLVAHAAMRRLRAPRGIGIAVVAGLALTLGVTTIRRNVDYRSTFSFWSDVVAKRPDNARARLWLGQHFYKSGRFQEALQQYETAVRLQPQNAVARFGLGVALGRLGRTAEAIDQYREAVRFNPRYARAHYNLALALSRVGQLEEVEGHLEAALRLKPDFTAARRALDARRGTGP